MSKKPLVPGSEDKLKKLKIETADELGADLNREYDGNMTSKEIGKIAGPTGGNMIKKMVEDYENKLK
ncbi:MAG: putative small acid-soluble spore protein [Clostridiaceae bacterium]|jgi:hypothetical protein|nr:putative small acid-soluble spore protein [Clostridiaceae bacterium]